MARRSKITVDTGAALFSGHVTGFAVKKARSQPEFRFHCSVNDFLNLVLPESVRWFHPANGERRDAAAAARLKRMGVKAGVPDIIIMHDGRTVGLELKAVAGKITESQADWHYWMRSHGFEAYIVRSLDELKAALSLARIPLKVGVTLC